VPIFVRIHNVMQPTLPTVSVDMIFITRGKGIIVFLVRKSILTVESYEREGGIILKYGSAFPEDGLFRKC